jgi:hypothetical protein
MLCDGGFWGGNEGMGEWLYIGTLQVKRKSSTLLGSDTMR